MTDLLTIGVIGLGVIAPYYLRAIERNPSVRLAAVCDRDPSKLAAFEQSVALATRDHAALAANSPLDAVVITAPNDLHASMCATALSAGLHVCCEKPLVLSSAHAHELAATAERADRVLFTAFHRRYNANVRRLVERVQRLAPLHAGIASCRVRYHERIEDHCGGDRWYLDPLRSGGGCLADNGPNALDLVRLVLGEIEVRDAGIGRRVGGLDVEATIDLVNGDGVPARVELDWGYTAGELKDVRVEFADGTIEEANMLAGFPYFKSSLEHEYDALVADFARAATGESHEPGDGVRVVELVENAYRSARRAAAADAA